MTRRPLFIGILFALLALSGCAAKKAPALPPGGAPHFPEYVFPAVPGQIASPAIGALHELGWQWLQAGDAKAAERNFTAALRQSPDFYPSEAGLGIRRSGAQGQQGSRVVLRSRARGESEIRAGSRGSRRGAAGARPTGSGAREFRGCRCCRSAAVRRSAAGSRS